jgi:hypothetical protein
MRILSGCLKIHMLATYSPVRTLTSEMLVKFGVDRCDAGAASHSASHSKGQVNSQRLKSP